MQPVADEQHAHAMLRHSVLVYDGPHQFVARTVPFVMEGVRGGEAVLVVADAAKLALLRDELDRDAERVWFSDMSDVGSNPGRMIGAWRDFVDQRIAEGQRARGVGEPILPGRSSAEVVECQHVEALFDLAFADSDPLTALCPYDAGSLPAAVIEHALACHPYLYDGVTYAPNPDYRATPPAPFTGPLAPPPRALHEQTFDESSLSAARSLVSAKAAGLGFDTDRTSDIALAVSEVAANSVLHGGGRGALRVWDDDGVLVCEIQDRGVIEEPLAGRLRPRPGTQSGYGLWLANRLSDLVQIRSGEDGTVVRLHFRGPAAG